MTVGFAYIGYQQYRHIRKREERKLNTVSDPEELLANDWTVRSFDLKFMSMGSSTMSVFEIGREQYFGQVVFRSQQTENPRKTERYTLKILNIKRNGEMQRFGTTTDLRVTSDV